MREVGKRMKGTKIMRVRRRMKGRERMRGREGVGGRKVPAVEGKMKCRGRMTGR